MSPFPEYDFSPYLVSLGRNWYLEDELLRRILADPASEKNVLRFREFAHDYYTAYQGAALSHYR